MFTFVHINYNKNTTMKTNYQNFVSRLMKSTGMTIDQMQTFEEWIENRKSQFENEADEKELKRGFQNWLNERY